MMQFYILKLLILQMLVDFTGGLSSLSHAATHSISSLHLDSVQMADNGNYTCHPAGLHKVIQSRSRVFSESFRLLG